MNKGKHVATYPIYGTDPISLRVRTNHRVGTGFLYSLDDIEKTRARLEQFGHPLHIRWRNEECRNITLANNSGDKAP